VTEPKIPELWWSPTKGVYRRRRDEFRLILNLAMQVILLDVDALPDDAVPLVPAPAAPRVWFPDEVVPARVPTMNQRGRIAKLGWDAVAADIEVEVTDMSPEQWQSAVDRAREQRANATWQHTEGGNP
jgi:hypothetical protein